MIRLECDLCKKEVKDYYDLVRLKKDDGKIERIMCDLGLKEVCRDCIREYEKTLRAMETEFIEGNALPNIKQSIRLRLK